MLRRLVAPTVVAALIGTVATRALFGHRFDFDITEVVTQPTTAQRDVSAA